MTCTYTNHGHLPPCGKPGVVRYARPGLVLQLYQLEGLEYVLCAEHEARLNWWRFLEHSRYGWTRELVDGGLAVSRPPE